VYERSIGLQSLVVCVKVSDQEVGRSRSRLRRRLGHRARGDGTEDDGLGAGGDAALDAGLVELGLECTPSGSTAAAELMTGRS